MGYRTGKIILVYIYILVIIYICINIYIYEMSKKSGFTPDLGTGSMMIIWLNWGYPMCTHS